MKTRNYDDIKNEFVTTTQVTEDNQEGIMPTKDLHKRLITTEDENELTHVIEYWRGPVGEVVDKNTLVDFNNCELVHRSVHVQLKKNVALFPEIAEVG